MRIAMIGHKRIPTRSGGVEVVVEELSTRMHKKGHSVDAYNRNCGEAKLKEYMGVRILEIPTAKRSGISAMMYSFLATMRCLFGKYDVVHYHAEGQCVALPIAKLFRKKVVATIHGLDWQRNKWGGFATKYLLFGEKMAAKYADKVIVLSNEMQKYFKDTYGRDTEFIPNGINRTEIEKPEIIKEKYGLAGKDYILFLARLTPEKGLDYLIDAYCGIKTDKKLVIAGAIEPETPYISELKNKVSGNHNIMMVGYVSGKELSELFSNCYLYVLPSDIEGMPMSLLEAVGYNARVIVSNIPENVDCLQGYGMSFKKGDPQDLKEKIEYCLNNPQLYDNDFKENMTKEAVSQKRRELMDLYSWDNIVDQTLSLYESVKKQKRFL